MNFNYISQTCHTSIWLSWCNHILWFIADVTTKETSQRCADVGHEAAWRVEFARNDFAIWGHYMTYLLYSTDRFHGSRFHGPTVRLHGFAVPRFGSTVARFTVSRLHGSVPRWRGSRFHGFTVRFHGPTVWLCGSTVARFNHGSSIVPMLIQGRL